MPPPAPDAAVPRLLFVTGRLAEPSLRRLLADLAPRAGFEPAVAVLPISVAALLTTNVLGDACEALIAALYEDGGLEVARTFIAEHWTERLTTAALAGRNAKAALQEWAQARGFDVPAYAIAAKSGPDHDPRFDVEVRVAKLDPARGAGKTRREAEQAAAALLLTREGVWSAKA